MKAEKSRSRFLLCVRNDGSDDLEPRKVYQVLPDPGAVREGFVRVIDESGEELEVVFNTTEENWREVARVMRIMIPRLISTTGSVEPHLLHCC